jgi:transposase
VRGGSLSEGLFMIVVVNPKRARDFAKALRFLAKTDRIDARVLAEFAERVRPEVRPLDDAATQKFQALLARPRQLIAMRTMEKNRLGTVTATPTTHDSTEQSLISVL